MPDISFQTDQSGANSEVCSTSSILFNFSVSSNYTVTQAVFVMKRGSTSTGNVTVAIHNGRDASGAVVASVSIAAASFSQSYTAMTFTFPANTNLTANSDYSLKVSSASSCGGSAAYFIKAGSFQVLAAGTQTVISVGYALSAAPAGQATLTGAVRATWRPSAPVTAAATLTASAQRGQAMSAACAAAAVLSAGVNSEQAVAADIAALTTLIAAASKLGANEINGWHHGTSRIDGLYVGSTRVTKAYLGSTLILDQPS